MALAAGTRLGHYEILGAIGAGGMGEVYSARDPRLERNVAIKVLPARLAGDAEALARFEREAKAVAALSDPGILAIFDFGREGDVAYAVTELLEGETFGARLAGGPLSLRKTLDLATQVALALAAAHSKGIVHRDLKPSNLFLTSDGRVKILDFGLARMTESSQPTGETHTLTVERHTSPGAVLGTVGYMSPEQVMGKPADTRSDIFSFGVVLYQMLSGRPLFQRATDVETLHAILKDEPPELAELQPPLPPAMQRILRHCLEKAPGERFQSARDLAFALESTREPSTASGVQTRVASSWPGKWLGRTAAALAFTALGAIVAVIVRPPGSAPPLTFKRLTFNRGTVETARFVPGGRNIVYSARLRGRPAALFSVHPDSLESSQINLAGGSLLSVSASEELAVKLRGRELNGAIQGTLAQVPMGGSGAREVHDGVIFADWSADGKQIAILWEDLHEIHRLEFPPGQVLVETRNNVLDLRLSPAADRAAYIERGLSAGGNFDIKVVDLNGRQSLLAHSAFPTGVAWSVDGKAVWFTEYDDGGYTNLRTVTLAGRSRLAWRGAGNFALQDIARDGRALLDLRHNESGVFAMALGSTKETDLSWLDQAYVDAISADGGTLLVSTFGATAVHAGAIYLVRTDGSAPVRLGPGSAYALSPDARWAVQSSPSSTAARLLPTGPGEARTIPLTGLERWLQMWFFPDGDRLLIEGRAPGRPLRFYVTGLAGGVPRAVTPEGTEAFQSQQVLSPDGQLIAAVCEDGQVRLFPVNGGAPLPVGGQSSDDVVLGWTAANKGLYVFDRERLPARVFVLDLATGRRTLWRELAPSDPSGVVRISNIRIRPDGRAYAYGFGRVLSELYLVEGLR